MTIQERLRAATQKLRTKFVPLCDMIPLMQEAADALDTLSNETRESQKDESDMLTIAYMHGSANAKDKIKALQKELKSARTLMCDVYKATTIFAGKTPCDVQSMISERTGNWFVCGEDRTDYNGK